MLKPGVFWQPRRLSRLNRKMQYSQKSSEKSRKQAYSGCSSPGNACFHCIKFSVYGDDGFSGTNTDHRQGFQKLMKDAMDGKIDMMNLMPTSNPSTCLKVADGSAAWLTTTALHRLPATSLLPSRRSRMNWKVERSRRRKTRARRMPFGRSRSSAGICLPGFMNR